MRDGRWKYTIRAYNARGDLIIETTHATEVSRDIEIEVFQTRMKRNEVACIDVIAHVEPFDTRRLYQ